MLEKIISGGQTGVDRAALDVAVELGISCGGWCPKGRRAEDGVIPDRYPLTETPWHGYPQRTQWNVRDSDATLVLIRGQADRGTTLTREFAARRGKPCLVIDLAEKPDAKKVVEWLRMHGIIVLNVAGSRESSSPGIHSEAMRFLRECFGGRGERSALKTSRRC